MANASQDKSGDSGPEPRAESHPLVRPGMGYRLGRAVVVAVVLFYAVSCILVFCFQRKLLFVPTVRSAEHTSQLARAAGLERWVNSAGVYLGMKRLSLQQPAAASILVCYGNGGTATGRASYVDELQNVAPVDVYVLQYPGYEDRPGSPSRESILAAATEALQAVGTNQPVYLLGESLGTGVAAYLAGRFPGRIAGLILLSPYERLADVAQYQYPWLPTRWLMLDDLWAGKFLAAYHGPVGVVVNGRDSIVPERFGRRLFDGYTGPKHLWAFPEFGHIQTGPDPEKFWRETTAFWKLNQTAN